MKANYVMGNESKIGQIIWIIIDAALILIGIIIIPLGVLGWKQAGFLIEAWSDGGTFEGRATFFTILIGIALALYGLFDMCVFRRSKKKDKEE
jgi:uncharacterized membrane protein